MMRKIASMSLTVRLRTKKVLSDLSSHICSRASIATEIRNLTMRGNMMSGGTSTRPSVQALEEVEGRRYKGGEGRPRHEPYVCRSKDLKENPCTIHVNCFTPRRRFRCWPVVRQSANYIYLSGHFAIPRG